MCTTDFLTFSLSCSIREMQKAFLKMLSRYIRLPSILKKNVFYFHQVLYFLASKLDFLINTCHLMVKKVGGGVFLQPPSIVL